MPKRLASTWYVLLLLPAAPCFAADVHAVFTASSSWYGREDVEGRTLDRHRQGTSLDSSGDPHRAKGSRPGMADAARRQDFQ